MKKNKMMRAASGLLVAALLSTSIISGTFAKYTTSVNSEDKARVAQWGFTQTSINLTNLFDDAYKDVATEYVADGNTVKASTENTDIIAPGTKGKATFGFTYGGAGKAPEVAYTFNVSTEGSECATDIKNNKNIQWKLDNGDWGTWDDLLTAIQALDGNVVADNIKNTPADYYAPNTLPTAFNAKAENNHTVEWQWVFESNTNKYGDNNETSQDQYDTAMGNKSELDDVTLKITITATQID